MTYAEEAAEASSEQQSPYLSRPKGCVFNFCKPLVGAAEDNGACHPCEEDLERMHAFAVGGVQLQKSSRDTHHDTEELGQRNKGESFVSDPDGFELASPS